MRVLILAYDFPPNSSIGGQRPYSWFKYFKGFGIHPVVVTRHWDEVVRPEDTIRQCGTEVTVTESDEGTLIRVPFRPNLRDRMLLRYGSRFPILRKTLSLWFTLAQYFIPWADNRRNILQAARQHLRENPCDAIIATGEPFILFRYAQLLSAEFGIPWVADYRDGWSTNYGAESGGVMGKMVNRHFMQPLERRLTGSSSLITTAAPAFRDELKELHPQIRVEVVMNGFFHELIEPQALIDQPSDQPFTIAYSGTLYPYQKLELFLDGASLFISGRGITPQDLRLLFIGMDFQDVARERLMAYSHQLLPFIETTPRMSAAEAVGRLRSSNAFLLLASRRFSPIPAKLFDYLALGKPILMCENDRATVEEILTDSGAGLIADTPEEVCAHIGTVYDRAFPMSPTKATDRFSRKHQAALLAAKLKDISIRP